MDEEKNEKENSQTTEEEETSKNETSEERETPKPEGASEDASELIEKNKRLYARAKKAEEDLKAAKEQLEKSKTTSQPEGEDQWRAKVDFLLKNREKNYSEEEFNHIAVVAKERGISLEDAAKSEEDYIKYQREKVEKAKNVPEPSSPSGRGEKSPKEMSREEHEKFFYDNIKRQRQGGTGI